MVTHDRDLASRVSRIVRIADGEIVETRSGTGYARDGSAERTQGRTLASVDVEPRQQQWEAAHV